MKTSTRSRIVLILGLVLAASPPASAADGVVEIHQACVASGCFPGDQPGFPVQIDGSAGRSYRLTSNLQVPDQNTTAVQIQSDGISIDLRGFAILGVTNCSGTPNTCTPTGNGRGIDAGSTTNDTHVHNGVVARMGSDGVKLGLHSLVENLRLVYNGGHGVSVRDNNTIRDCVVHRNGDNGLVANKGATASGNVATDNGGTGIFAFGDATVVGNVASGNDKGIDAAIASTVSGNATSNNASDGITAWSSSITGNTAQGNGGDGISCVAGCTLRGNAVRANNGYGLMMSPHSAFSHNVSTNNGTGAVRFGFNRGDNYCAGDAIVSEFCSPLP